MRLPLLRPCSPSLAPTAPRPTCLQHSPAPYCPQVSERPVLVLQPAGGLYFPTIEALREALVRQALQGTWARAGLAGSPRAPRWPLCTQPAPHGPALGCQGGCLRAAPLAGLSLIPGGGRCLHVARALFPQHASLRACTLPGVGVWGDRPWCSLCGKLPLLLRAPDPPCLLGSELSRPRAAPRGVTGTRLSPQRPRRAAPSWTAATSAASTTPWCWGSGSSWGTSADRASPLPLSACRWVSPHSWHCHSKPAREVSLSPSLCQCEGAEAQRS